MTRLDRSLVARHVERSGIRSGMNVFVHSSLSGIGHVEGGASTVVDGLLDVLGPTGTLMVPTFTFSRTRVFDVIRSPSATGAISEAVRQRPDSVRSPHPSHASCAIGPLAEWLMADHLRTGPLAIDSPEDRMASVDGYVFLLGVGHTVNSTVHVGEAYAGAPARRTHFNPLAPVRMTVVSPDRAEIVVTLTDMPGCSAGFGAVESPLRSLGAISDGHVGEAPCQLMRGDAVIRETVALLRRDPYALMCSNTECGTCAKARVAVDQRRELAVV